MEEEEEASAALFQSKPQIKMLLQKEPQIKVLLQKNPQIKVLLQKEPWIKPPLLQILIAMPCRSTSKLSRYAEFLKHILGSKTLLLEDLDVSFTSDTVVRVIRAASSPTSSLGFLNRLTLKGFEQALYVPTYGAMLDMLGEARSIDDMKNLIEEMRKSFLVLDSGLHDILIHWCVCHGDAIRTSSFLEKMKEEGIAMSASTYTSMFDLHVKEGKYKDAVTMYPQMVEEAVLPRSSQDSHRHYQNHLPSQIYSLDKKLMEAKIDTSK